MNVRRVHDWIALGLLDQPRLHARRRGSVKAEHSVNQRQLLLLLLAMRQQVAQLSAPAQVPLWMWLWWDGYVPTRQAQRAVRQVPSHGTRGSAQEAQRTVAASRRTNRM